MHKLILIIFIFYTYSVRATRVSLFNSTIDVQDLDQQEWQRFVDARERLRETKNELQYVVTASNELDAHQKRQLIEFYDLRVLEGAPQLRKQQKRLFECLQARYDLDALMSTIIKDNLHKVTSSIYNEEVDVMLERHQRIFALQRLFILYNPDMRQAVQRSLSEQEMREVENTVLPNLDECERQEHDDGVWTQHQINDRVRMLLECIPYQVDQLLQNRSDIAPPRRVKHSAKRGVSMGKVFLISQLSLMSAGFCLAVWLSPGKTWREKCAHACNWRDAVIRKKIIAALIFITAISAGASRLYGTPLRRT